MRHLTLAALSVSALAISGCSFFGGGHDDSYGYNKTSMPAPYSHGSYSGNAHTQGAYSHGSYAQNAHGTYTTGSYGTAVNHHGTHAHAQAPVVNNHHASGTDCCLHGEKLSTWSLEGGIGPAFLIGNEAVTGDKINAANPNTVNNIDMADAYDTGIRADIGISKALTPNRKISLSAFKQQHNSAGSQNWGIVNDEVLTGELTDYNAYGIEAGLRQYFQPTVLGNSVGLRPYVEGKLGGAHVDDIAIRNTQLDGATFSAADLAFYEGGWVPTGAGLIGVETPVADRLTLGVETGVRYIGKLASDDQDLLPGGPISGSNNGSDTWTVPLTIRGRYRF